MKWLKLTEQHRAMLLEMCRDLLKDKAEHSEGTTDGITLERHNTSDNWFVLFYHDDGTDRIHWFELCMKDLLYAIAEPGGKSDPFEVILMRDLVGSLPNPVDYLYSKFKKLHHENDSIKTPS